MQHDTELKEFRLPIDAERKAELAVEMSHLLREGERRGDDLKRYAANVKDDIKGLLSKARRLGDDIEEGKETQLYPIYREVDFAENVVRFMRASDGTILQVRAMTPAEREAEEQQELPMEEKTGKDAAAGD